MHLTLKFGNRETEETIELQMASQFVSSTPRFCSQVATRNDAPRYCFCKQKYGVPQAQLSNIRSSYNNISIKTLDNCQMKISQYSFLYNAEGGRGTGSLVKVKEDKCESNAPLRFDFDLGTVYIPPMTNKTSKFVGQIPLPPMFKVEIVPEIIKAKIYEESGKVELQYKAKLCLSIGNSLKAPPLLVDMLFTTEELNAAIAKSTRGKRLDKDGKCRLVGVARVDPIDDYFINTVIGLPSDCLTSLNVIISLS